MRRNKYQTNVAPFLKEIGQMARNGATEEEIAAKLRVAYSTFRKYKAAHRELYQVLMESKELADLNVEAALYKRACGYETEEVTKERIFNRTTGEFEMVTVKTVTKHIPPETAAGAFFLKNRRPALWKDRHDVEVSVPVNDTAEKIKEILDSE